MEVQAGAAAAVASVGGPSMGALLQGLGRRLAGKKVMRHWPDNGGWWEADVDTYNASTGQHRCSPSLHSTQSCWQACSSAPSNCSNFQQLPPPHMHSVNVTAAVQGCCSYYDQRAALSTSVELC